MPQQESVIFFISIPGMSPTRHSWRLPISCAFKWHGTWNTTLFFDGLKPVFISPSLNNSHRYSWISKAFCETSRAAAVGNILWQSSFSASQQLGQLVTISHPAFTASYSCLTL